MGLEVLSIAGTVIGGITSAIGAIQQGSAQAASAKYQAQVARNNQIVAEQNARYAVAAGESRAQSRDFKNRAVIGAITAAQGASGLSLDSPASREIRESSEQLGRLDTATIMQDAMLTARSQETQASNFGAQAGLYDLTAANARTASYGSAFSSLLSGASSFSDKWLRYQSPSPSLGYGSWSPRY